MAALADLPQVLSQLRRRSSYAFDPESRLAVHYAGKKVSLFKFAGNGDVSKFGDDRFTSSFNQIVGLRNQKLLAVRMNKGVREMVELNLRDLKSGRVVAKLPSVQIFLDVNSAKQVALATGREGIQLVDLRNGKVRWSKRLASTVVTCGTLSHDAGVAAIGTADGRVVVFDSRTGKTISQRSLKTTIINSLAFARNSDGLAVGAGLSKSGLLVMLDKKTGRILFSRHQSIGPLASVRFLSRGAGTNGGEALVATPFLGSSDMVFDSRTGKKLKSRKSFKWILPNPVKPGTVLTPGAGGWKSFKFGTLID